MKRYFIFIAIVTASIITACEQKPIIELPLTDNGAYLFTLNAIVDNELTKTDYEGNSFKWSYDDQISVLFHNGTDNKFFTLTATTGGSNSTSFSGLIDEGYEIGASDTETQWALFPASESHSYSEGDTYPTFYIEPTKDYSESHYSADLPMISVGSEGVFSFKYLTGAYRFTFTDLDVNKVTLVVRNQESYFISGATPIGITGSTYYLKHNYAFSEQPEHSLSFTENVNEGSATFYVPFKIWEGQFKPTLTLSDASTGYIIKQLKANKSVGDSYTSALGKVWIMPSIPAPGTGTAPIFDGINWSDSNVATSTLDEWQQSTIGLTELKVIASTQYMFVRVKGAQSSITGNNFMDIYLSDGAEGEYVWGDYWRTTGSVIYKKEHKGTVTASNLSMTFNDSTIETKTESSGSDIFWFMAIPRDAHSLLQSAGTVYVGVSLWTGWSISGMIPSRRTYDHDSYLMNVSLP